MGYELQNGKREQKDAKGAKAVSESRSGLVKERGVFGEGTNPRLSKIRDGLNELGLPTDELLNHGAPRLINGVALVENLREYLLGMERRPKYVAPRGNAAAATEWIVRWWVERWVAKRVTRDEVLERMARETLVHPIEHGARVKMPRRESEQRVLFE